MKRKGSRSLGEVQRLWGAGMASSSHQSSDDDRENLTSETDMRARRAEGASAETSRCGGERTTTGEVATDDTFATSLAGRAARFGSDEGAGTGQSDDRRQRSAGERKERQRRVARVAAFARWAEAVTATADDTESQTKRARKRAGGAERRGAAAAVSDITTAGSRVEAHETTGAAPRGSAAPATGGGAEHNPFAKTVRHARSQGSDTERAARKGSARRVQIARRAVVCAVLLRRSEGQHLITTPLPIPVTSRFGAPIPVTKATATRSYKSALESAVPCWRGTVSGRW